MLSVHFHNLTGGETSDYEYVVTVNQNRIAEGRVNGHRHQDRWPALLMRLVRTVRHQRRTLR